MGDAEYSSRLFGLHPVCIFVRSYTDIALVVRMMSKEHFNSTSYFGGVVYSMPS